MFTLGEFVNLPLFEWTRMLSAPEGLNKIAVKYISVIEIPVDDFVREGELVLTTALGCLDDSKVFLQFVTEVWESKACALALGIQGNVCAIPKAVTDFGKEKNFPLILIPWECRFAEIVEVVGDRVRGDRLVKIKLYESIQKKLLTAYLENQKLEIASEIIARQLECAVAILDENRNLRQSSLYTVSDSKALEEETPFMTVNIRTSSRLYGYLSLYVKDNAQADIVEPDLIEQYVIGPLTLWFDKEWVIRVTQQNLKDDFVWRLARSKDAVSDEMREQAKVLGINLNLAYSCVAGKISHAKSEDWMDSHINSIRENVIKVSHTLKTQVLITYQQGLLIFFLQNKLPSSEKNLHKFLDMLEQHVNATSSDLKYAWGISEISMDNAVFHRHFSAAKLAQELCVNSSLSSNRYLYENTVVFHILSVLAANSDIKKMAYDIIKPLIDYEQLNNINIIDTLKKYIQHGNSSQTARELHIHRQSLLYRLAKIEEITGLSLKNHNDIFLLEICLRLHFDYH